MDSCAEIRKELPMMEQWVQWKGSSRCAQPKKAGNGCEADITACLPQHVVKYQDANPAISGPNCWNLALVMKGILPHLNYTAENDLTFYLDQPLCHKVKPSEGPKPGDIGAIRHGPQEIHAFIYVSKQLAYSKNGSEKQAPYALQPLNQVLEFYSVGESSTDFEEEACFGEAECEKPVDVTYYRCKSMDQYLAEKTAGKPQFGSVIDATRRLEFLECGVSSYYMDHGYGQTDLARQMEDVGEALNVFLKSELKVEELKPQRDPAARFLLESLSIRLDRMTANLNELANYGFFAGDWYKETRELQGALMQALESLPADDKSKAPQQRKK